MIFKTLIEEHRLIKAALDSAQRSKDMLENDEYPDVQFFNELIVFAKNFVDKFHHFKEEYIMFGLLAQKKGGLLDAEIGALRFQHERNRFFMSEIKTSLPGYIEKEEIAITHLLENLASYISVLRRHIVIEEKIYFPIVEKDFNEEDNNMLKKQFENELSDKTEIIKQNQTLVKEMESLLTK
ncbi:MAG: hypothetical protein GY793_01370 [Proteobacteria bacterium]|nr:hypothetical protein [Pseudomonadota bacterium]